VLVAAAAVLSASAVASTTERPANQLTKYVASLRVAAKQAEAARLAASKLDGKACGTFGPAAGKLAGAASAARSAFDAYRKAKTRYGTQEEIGLISALILDLREARGHLAEAAGESAVPSAAEQQAATREISLFQAFLARKIEDRLQIEGLADVLTSTSFAEVKGKVVTELQQRLHDRAEAEIRRIAGFRIKLGVPLKQQIRDFLEGELSSTLSKLAVSAGPAGIIVSLVGRRLVSLVGHALQEALRQKGKVVDRTNATVAGFERYQAQLRSLPKDATLDRVRGVVRGAERALAATSFLEGDLKRARRADLLTKLAGAETKLQTTLFASRQRFLLDSDLVGEDFRLAVSFAASVHADAARLAKKAGCPLGGGGAKVADKGVSPTSGTCPPSFTMESLRSLPPYDATGEFPASFSKLEKTGTFSWRCLYLRDSGAEAFVIFIDVIPPDTPGALASGACGSTAPDSPPFYRSRKRYVTVSGGERGAFTRAKGGNEAILKQALALAEAQGVGQACA
jgi:hypothetical protein